MKSAPTQPLVVIALVKTQSAGLVGSPPQDIRVCSHSQQPTASAQLSIVQSVPVSPSHTLLDECIYHAGKISRSAEFEEKSVWSTTLLDVAGPTSALRTTGAKCPPQAYCELMSQCLGMPFGA